MNRYVPSWILLAGLTACGAVGMVVMQNRRANKMRRMMRKASKTLESVSSAIMHIFA